MAKQKYRKDPNLQIFSDADYEDAYAPLGEQAQEHGRGLLRTAGDFATKVVGGVPKAAAGIVGLGGLAGLGDITDPIAQGLNASGEWIEDQLLSDEQKRQDAELQAVMARNEGFVDSAKAAGAHILENPLQGVMMAGESIPSILGGGYMAKGIKAGAGALGLKRVAGMSATTAGAVGEGTMMAGSASNQIVEQNPDATYADRLWAVPAGGVGALISLGGGRLAGGSDIDTIAARAIAGDTAERLAGRQTVDLLERASPVYRRSVKAGMIEGAEEFAQSAEEQAFTNIGSGQNWDQGVGASGVLGAVAGQHMGMVGGLRRPENTYTDQELQAAAGLVDDPQADHTRRLAAADFIRRTKMQDPAAAQDWHTQAVSKINADASVQEEQRRQRAEQAAVEEEAAQQKRTDMLMLSRQYPYAAFEADYKAKEKDRKKALEDAKLNLRAEYAANSTGEGVDAYVERRLDEIGMAEPKGEKPGDRIIRKYQEFLEEKYKGLAGSMAAAEQFEREQQQAQEAPQRGFTLPGENESPRSARDAGADMEAAIAGLRRERWVNKAPGATDDMFTGDATTNYPTTEPAPATSETDRQAGQGELFPLQYGNENADIPNTEMRGVASPADRFNRDVLLYARRAGVTSIAGKGKGKKKRAPTYSDKVMGAMRAAVAARDVGALDATDMPEVFNEIAMLSNNPRTAEETYNRVIENAVLAKQGVNTVKARKDNATVPKNLNWYGVGAAYEAMSDKDKKIVRYILGTDDEVSEAQTVAATAKSFGVSEEKVRKVLGALGADFRHDVKRAISSDKATATINLADIAASQQEEGGDPEYSTGYQTVDTPATNRNIGLEENRAANRIVAQGKVESEMTAMELALAKARAETEAKRQKEVAKQAGELAATREAQAKKERITFWQLFRAYRQPKVQAAIAPLWERYADTGLVEAGITREPSWRELSPAGRFAWFTLLHELAVRQGLSGFAALEHNTETMRPLVEYVLEELDGRRAEQLGRAGRTEQSPGGLGVDGEPLSEGRQDEAAFRNAEEVAAAKERRARSSEGQSEATGPVAEPLPTGAATVAPLGKNAFGDTVPMAPVTETKYDTPIETGNVKPVGSKPIPRDAFGTKSKPIASALAKAQDILKKLDREIIETGNGSGTKANRDLKKRRQALKVEIFDLREKLEAAREEDKQNGSLRSVEDVLAQGETDNTVPGTVFDTNTPEEGPAATKFSVGQQARGQPASAVSATVRNLFGNPYFFDRAVAIVDTAGDLPADALTSVKSEKRGDIQGLYHKGKVYLVAGNIAPGRELAVFLHEVGVHMGMENLLGPVLYEKLLAQIETWEKGNYGDATYYAKRARARIKDATEASGEQSRGELLAYFVEEAVALGVDPTVIKGNTPIGRWFRHLWAAVRVAIRKLGMNPDRLTAQNVVDLAYGAARMEVNGSRFGAVANERKFSIAAPTQTANPQTTALEQLGDLAAGPAAAARKVSLGAMPLNWMEQFTGSEAVAQYRSAITSMQADAETRVYEASKIDQDWEKLTRHPSEMRELSSLMRDTTLAQFDPTKDKPRTPEEHALMDRYNALAKAGPKAQGKDISLAADLYSRVRDYFEANDKERRDILKELAEAAGKDVRGEIDRMVAKMKGPYFPLKRLGTWYVSGMSRELADLLAKEAPSIQEKRRIEELKADPQHYWTSTHDSVREARRKERELRRQFPATKAPMPVEEALAIDVAIKSPDLVKVRDYLMSRLPEEARGTAASILAEMYYDMLPEHHHLKARMRRIGVAGANEDMRRVFAHTSLNQAHYISRLKHGTKLSEAMVKVREEGRNDAKSREVFNELNKRSALAFERDAPPWVNNLLTASYMAHLGISPAFLLTNLTQVPMVALPWLGGRHSYRAATAELATGLVDAKRLLSTSIHDSGTWMAELSWKGKLRNEGEERLLENLIDRKLLDVTIEHNLGAVADMRSPKVAKYLRLANLPVRLTELANRTSVSLAAYRLFMAKPRPADTTEAQWEAAAITHAARALEETQFNYSALNAPRYIQSVLGSKVAARLVSQFRKYQINMLMLMAKSIMDANPMGSASPEVRREALRTLFGVTAMTGLFAGALGLPFMGSVMWLATLIGGAGDDDDEPFDAETWLKNWVTDITDDPEVARAITNGLPTLVGMNLTKRVGAGDIASPLPFMRTGTTTQESAGYMMLAAAGAPVGTMVDMVDGAKYMADGQWLKGFEKFAPLKFAKDLAHAARMQTEGLTNSKGEVFMEDDKFSAWDLTQRYLGFSPDKEAMHFEMEDVIQQGKRGNAEVRSRLLRDFAGASIAGESTEDVMEEIKAYNRRHPDSPIDYAARRKAVKSRRTAAKQRNEYGVRMDKAAKEYSDDVRFAG